MFWNVLTPCTVPLFFDVSFPRGRWSFVKRIMMHNCLPFLSISVANNGVLIRASQRIWAIRTTITSEQCQRTKSFFLLTTSSLPFLLHNKRRQLKCCCCCCGSTYWKYEVPLLAHMWVWYFWAKTSRNGTPRRLAPKQ